MAYSDTYPGQRHAVMCTGVDALPEYEALQLVERSAQLLVVPDSVFAPQSLAAQRAFIAEYHACGSVTAFLREKGITTPAPHFGRFLPSVRYQLAHPCRYCGQPYYTRKVATHSQRFHKMHGALNCSGCDAWIVLSDGPLYGQSFSLQCDDDPPLGSKCLPTEPAPSPVDIRFMEAVIHTYVPEYHHAAIGAYLAGEITLETVQDRTGIQAAARGVEQPSTLTLTPFR